MLTRWEWETGGMFFVPFCAPDGYLQSSLQTFHLPFMISENGNYRAPRHLASSGADGVLVRGPVRLYDIRSFVMCPTFTSSATAQTLKKPFWMLWEHPTKFCGEVLGRFID